MKNVIILLFIGILVSFVGCEKNTTKQNPDEKKAITLASKDKKEITEKEENSEEEVEENNDCDEEHVEITTSVQQIFDEISSNPVALDNYKEKCVKLTSGVINEITLDSGVFLADEYQEELGIERLDKDKDKALTVVIGSLEMAQGEEQTIGRMVYCYASNYGSNYEIGKLKAQEEIQVVGKVVAYESDYEYISIINCIPVSKLDQDESDANNGTDTTTDETNTSDRMDASNIDGKYSFTAERNVIESDLENLSAWDLDVMRNEIYARHGYIFPARRQDLKEYFETQSWYSFMYDKDKDIVPLMNKYEYANIGIIVEYQKKNNKFAVSPPSKK